MAGKSPKKDASTESDADFLKRILKAKDEATKKASVELSAYSKSEEVEKLRETGRRTAKDFEEIEECERIAEEFKRDPPIVTTRHVNGVSMEYKYDDRYKGKIELLKKHSFSFLCATKDTSIFSPIVTAHGRAYVKRGGQRIQLPENSTPPVKNKLGMGSQALDPSNVGFILRDGDVIATEEGSYASVNDFISNDDYHKEIFIFPNSEAVIRVSEKIEHHPPAFMDPSRVPDAIKRNCENTVMNYNILKFALVKGIFKVSIHEKNRNVNNSLELSSGSPQIEFLNASKTYESMLEKEYKKLAVIPNAAKAVAAYKDAMEQQRGRLCEEIAAHIELCADMSIVVFGSMNSIQSKRSGRVASHTFSNLGGKETAFSGKVMAVGDRVYSDKSGVDPRVKAIMNYEMALTRYVLLLAQRKEFEQKLKELKENKSKQTDPESESSRKEKEKRKAELLEQQVYYKQAGDAQMAEAIQMQLDELEPEKETETSRKYKEVMRAELLENQKHYRQIGNTLLADSVQYQLDKLNAPNDPSIDENYTRTMLRWCDNELAKLEPSVNASFPSYNSPNEADAI
ncbi:MAG: hypothetical protein ABIH99_01815 [Candidatus Micrarchaeota archaeon]